MSIKHPLFSIITCTYNSEKFINECIDSVSCQTFKSYEHILVDGYSTDKTSQFLKKYKRGRDNIKIINTLKRGISNAFNIGILNSSGDYILFLNSDDCLVDSEVLKDVGAVIKYHADIDWFYGKIIEVNESGRPIGAFPRNLIFQRPNYWILKIFNYIPHQSVFIKRKVFNKYGKFDESINYAMDYEYWLRIGNKTKWKFIDRIVTKYRYWSSSNSSNPTNRKAICTELNNMLKRYLNPCQLCIWNMFNNFARIFTHLMKKQVM